MIYAMREIPIGSGLLLANPIPEESALSRSEMDRIMAQAVQDAQDRRIEGSANTPFVLSQIAKTSKGATTKANVKLVEANVVRAANIAVELARLELQGDSNSKLR